MRHSVSTELLNKLLGYISQRPFAEVHELIAALQKDAELIKEVEEEDAEPLTDTTNTDEGRG